MRSNDVIGAVKHDVFFIEIGAALKRQKPEVTIRLANDATTANGVTKHQNRLQLIESLVKLGVDRRTVENDLEGIYAPIEGDPMAGESACYTLNITIAQARDFGWED